jgi:hypothetical protein
MSQNDFGIWAVDEVQIYEIGSWQAAYEARDDGLTRSFLQLDDTLYDLWRELPQLVASGVATPDST